MLYMFRGTICLLVTLCSLVPHTQFKSLYYQVIKNIIKTTSVQGKSKTWSWKICDWVLASFISLTLRMLLDALFGFSILICKIRQQKRIFSMSFANSWLKRQVCSLIPWEAWNLKSGCQGSCYLTSQWQVFFLASSSFQFPAAKGIIQHDFMCRLSFTLVCLFIHGLYTLLNWVPLLWDASCWIYDTG